MGQGMVVQQPEFTWERVSQQRDGITEYCKQVLDVAGTAVDGLSYANYVARSICVQDLPFPNASDHRPVSLDFAEVRPARNRR